MFWWVLGGMAVLVGAVLLRDKATRRKVIRAIARRWERGRKRKARAHVKAQRASAKGLTQVKPLYERPRRPKLLATKCSAACRTSRKPAFDRKTGQLLCDCPCGGREHGMYRPGAVSAPKAAPKGTAAGTSGTQPATAPVSTTKTATTTKPRPPSPPAQPVSPKRPPQQPTTWRGLQVETWGRMRTHAEQNPRCAGGTYSVQTFRDRRTDPPKVTQELKCDTCGSALR